MDPTVLAELIYAIEYELAYTPSDFFIRRTSALFFNIDWVREHKQTVIDYMSDAFQWTDEQRKYYELELNESLHEAANPRSEERRVGKECRSRRRTTWGRAGGARAR